MMEMILRMRVLRIIKLEAIILCIQAKCSLIGTWLFKNWAGDIFPPSGYVRTSNSIHMWPSKSRKVLLITWRQPSMKSKSCRKSKQQLIVQFGRKEETRLMLSECLMPSFIKHNMEIIFVWSSKSYDAIYQNSSKDTTTRGYLQIYAKRSRGKCLKGWTFCIEFVGLYILISNRKMLCCVLVTRKLRNQQKMDNCRAVNFILRELELYRK